RGVRETGGASRPRRVLELPEIDLEIRILLLELAQLVRFAHAPGHACTGLRCGGFRGGFRPISEVRRDPCRDGCERDHGEQRRTGAISHAGGSELLVDRTIWERCGNWNGMRERESPRRRCADGQDWTSQRRAAPKRAV